MIALFFQWCAFDNCRLISVLFIGYKSFRSEILFKKFLENLRISLTRIPCVFKLQ